MVEEKPAVMSSGLFSFSPLPLGEGRVRVGLLESPAAMFEKLRAASAPQAGYLSLLVCPVCTLVQRKVTQRKHAPEPPTSPALLASTGREPNSPSA